jgi:Na+-transporting NADH:ubiquinone oxidoreductase subunit NqrB
LFEVSRGEAKMSQFLYRYVFLAPLFGFVLGFFYAMVLRPRLIKALGRYPRDVYNNRRRIRFIWITAVVLTVCTMVYREYDPVAGLDLQFWLLCAFISLELSLFFWGVLCGLEKKFILPTRLFDRKFYNP